VGKTTLIRELAYRKAELSLDRDILETTAARMIKELTGERGWQDNIMHFIKELRETDAILFVRNLRELFEVGQYVGNEVSVADFLQPFLTRGEITLVGESTEAEKSQIELRSPSYLAGFHVLNIEEPRGKRLEKIILDRVSTTAGQQEVSVTKEAIHEVVRLNKRFSPYAGFPGKPIRFLESLILERKADDRYRSKRLGKSEIIRHFCEASGLPIFMVDPSVPMQLERTDSFFSNQLFGQPDAVKSLVDVLASVKTALTRTGKPIASFLFVGPTGVGKTEFAKVLAEYMFGSRDRMERFDMSEYASPYAVGQLTGLIPGQDGILTAALRRQPFSVVLFDEIEKAHPSFYDLLLQVLSEGRLSDPKGQVANFCSSIIIMTSNIGASNLQENRIGWTREVDQNTVQTHFQAAVQSHFRPELVNRIDKIIPFVPLGQEEMKKVLDREIRLLRNREGINNRKMHFQIEEEVLDYLAQKGYDPVYGARYLQRTLREELIIPLARALNREDLDDQLAVKAILKGGESAYSGRGGSA
jgi:ATP-dependent Clp protease ATP-binding subunit ClpA